MDITVLICTRNRASTLRDCLESLTDSQLPQGVQWEVVVVDNHSSDQTCEVVKEFCHLLPGRFRYLYEATPGKSYALNAGIEAAKGSVVAFMDDDVKVTSTWLFHLTAPLLKGECAGTGGRTLPEKLIPLPSWLALSGPYALGGILAAMFDLGNEACELDRAPYGANMAFRRSMFEKYGGFRVDLGPSPCSDVPRPNEDTEFGRRLMAAGERLRYEPLAVVYHPISAERIEKNYFLSWWFDYGRASMREGGRKSDIFGVPRHWIVIPKIILRFLIPSTIKWALSIRPQRRFYKKCWIWVALGQMREMRRLYGTKAVG